METSRERAAKEQEKQQYIESLPLREDYKQVFGTPAGNRVLLDMIKRGHVYASRFTNNGWTAFNEGECNFVLMLADYAPDAFREATVLFFDEVVAEQARHAAKLLNDQEG